jgi:hypothetical protein
MSRTLVVSSLLGLVSLLAGCQRQTGVVGGDTSAARTRGAEAAKQDIANGVLKDKEYPPLPYSLQEINYIRLMKAECGVEREAVQGPTDSPELRAEVAGYNEVMHAEIARRFGADIFEKMREKAEAKK